MKGGKHGRTRRSSTRGAKADRAQRGASGKGDAKRVASDGPHKGVRKKPEFGGLRTTGEE